MRRPIAAVIAATMAGAGMVVTGTSAVGEGADMRTSAAAGPVSGTTAAASAETLDMYANWILGRADGQRRNGLMRKLPYLHGATLYNGATCTADAPCLQPDVEQSTAACVSLEFLSRYFLARAAAEGRPVPVDEQTILHEFADAVLAYRVDPDPVHADMFDGAVASSLGGTQLYYTAFGNAACGHALLAAHDITGATTYVDAAVGIGDFLLRMQDPRPYYAAYGAHPFVGANGSPTEPTGGFFDQVSSWNNLYSTMSLWNMTAVPFLQELEDEVATPDGRYAASAARARDFLEGGLTLGTDWQTVRFSSPATAKNRIVAMSAYSADCQDNRWHRKGSCEYVGDLPAGGTLDTDMIEYGLAGLYRFEAAVNGTAAAQTAVAGHYVRYTSLPAVHTASAVDPLDCVDDTRAGPVDPYYPPDNQADTPTGDPWDYDPHLSFGGYVYSSGTDLTRHEAKYYDIVGFGILAEVRAAVVPEKFVHGYDRLVWAGQKALAGIQQRILTPMALPGKDSDDLDGDGDTVESVCITTEGTLPIAHNGLGILATIGYVALLAIAADEQSAADLPEAHAARFGRTSRHRHTASPGHATTP